MAMFPRIRDLREDRDLTQREIARVLEINEDEVALLHVSAMSKMQVEMLEYMDIFINAV